MKLLIKNGRLLDPGTGTDDRVDILVEEGRIERISSTNSIKPGGDVTLVEASGLVVCPGFVDMHVHLREPGQEHKETIESGSAAAVHGGFTSIACMPNTDPVIDDPGLVERVIDRAREVGLVNVFPVAAITRGLSGEHLTGMADLAAAGAVGFSDDGKCVMQAEMIRRALIEAAKLGVPVIEHAEDHTISRGGQVHEGAVSQKLGLEGILNASEDVIVARDIVLQQSVSSRLHLTHLSSAKSVDLIRRAKRLKIKVTSDVTPHHLLLSEDAITTPDPAFKMKPPLRSEADRLALVEGIRDGSIDCIASDHAPHSREEKSAGFEKAPFGVIGMETSFPVIYDRLVRPGLITLEELIRLFSTHPAKILNLEDRGVVRPGAYADLTILNLGEEFEITPGFFYSKSNNCPFTGWTGRGVIEATIVSGKVRYHRNRGIITG